MGVHYLRKALISANDQETAHAVGVFGQLLAGSRYGAHVFGALAGGSTKEPAQDLKSASKI